MGSPLACDGAAAIPPSYCVVTDSDTQTCPQTRTHTHARAPALARTHMRSVGSVQDFESHRLQFQSGLKRLEKIGEEGAS